jgi:hypothetical protein
MARQPSAVAEVGDECLTDICWQRQAVDASALSFDTKFAGPPVDVIERHRRDLAGA